MAVSDEESDRMTKYLISFDGEAMMFREHHYDWVVRDAPAVIGEAKTAGVYIFSGGIDGDVGPVLVAVDGTVAEGAHLGHKVRNGGYSVLDLSSREATLEWAGMIAVACRCAQENR